MPTSGASSSREILGQGGATSVSGTVDLGGRRDKRSLEQVNGPSNVSNLKKQDKHNKIDF